MKIKALIKALEKLQKNHGNIEVLLLDGNGKGSIPFDIAEINVRTVEDDKWKSYNMPEGFEYIQLYGP